MAATWLLLLCLCVVERGREITALPWGFNHLQVAFSLLKKMCAQKKTVLSDLDTKSQ